MRREEYLLFAIDTSSFATNLDGTALGNLFDIGIFRIDINGTDIDILGVNVNATNGLAFLVVCADGVGFAAHDDSAALGNVAYLALAILDLLLSTREQVVLGIKADRAFWLVSGLLGFAFVVGLVVAGVDGREANALGTDDDFTILSETFVDELLTVVLGIDGLELNVL